MRWFAVLGLAFLLAGCMQSGGGNSSTAPHTFSTTTPPTSSSSTTTTTGTGIVSPPRIAVLEIDGWVNGTGPPTLQTSPCSVAPSARVDIAGKKLHLPSSADSDNQLRLVVFDRSQSMDNATEGQGCRVSTLTGFAAGTQTYAWRIETASGWVTGDRTFRLEPGTSTLAVDNLLLPIGKPRAVPVEFNWTRDSDGAQYHYEGTLWLTFHSEWPRAALLRDYEATPMAPFGRDEAVWQPVRPIV